MSAQKGAKRAAAEVRRAKRRREKNAQGRAWIAESPPRVRKGIAKTKRLIEELEQQASNELIREGCKNKDKKPSDAPEACKHCDTLQTKARLEAEVRATEKHLPKLEKFIVKSGIAGR